MQEQLFTQTATRLRPRLIALACSILRNDEEAADAVQDALVLLWRMGERVQTADEAERVVMRITRNVSLNKQKRRRLQTTPLESIGTDALPALTARQQNPQEAMERQERERSIDRAIHQLPTAQQVAIVLHYMDGLTYGQIAAIRGTSEAAVRMTAARAKEHLIKLLKQ